MWTRSFQRFILNNGKLFNAQLTQNANTVDFEENSGDRTTKQHLNSKWTYCSKTHQCEIMDSLVGTFSNCALSIKLELSMKLFSKLLRYLVATGIYYVYGNFRLWILSIKLKTNKCHFGLLLVNRVKMVSKYLIELIVFVVRLCIKCKYSFKTTIFVKISQLQKNRLKRNNICTVIVHVSKTVCMQNDHFMIEWFWYDDQYSLDTLGNSRWMNGS